MPVTEQGTGKGPEEMKIDHADVESRPAAAQGPVEIDPEMEKRVRRKLDYHIVPLVAGLYLLAFLDRSNIGYVLTHVLLLLSITGVSCLLFRATETLSRERMKY